MDPEPLKPGIHPHQRFFGRLELYQGLGHRVNDLLQKQLLVVEERLVLPLRKVELPNMGQPLTKSPRQHGRFRTDEGLGRLEELLAYLGGGVLPRPDVPCLAARAVFTARAA